MLQPSSLKQQVTGYGEALTPPEKAPGTVRTTLEPLSVPDSETPTW